MDNAFNEVLKNNDELKRKNDALELELDYLKKSIAALTREKASSSTSTHWQCSFCKGANIEGLTVCAFCAEKRHLEKCPSDEE